MVKGWKYESNRHALAAKGIKTTTTKTDALLKAATQKTLKPIPKREYGFDLTTFKNSDSFKKILKKNELINYKKVKHPLGTGGQYFSYEWSNKDVKLVTGNNPITGEYSSPNMKAPEKGYASYIGIEGKQDKVLAIAKDIKSKATSIEGENTHSRRYI